MDITGLLARLGLPLPDGDLPVRSPIDGSVIASAPRGPAVNDAVDRAAEAFSVWKSVPAPRRGELIRLFGEVLRQAKADLGLLVTLETGKILQEGLGEVQEMIDICDFAVGLSRQLHGLTIASERPAHRMMETWHPLGPVAVVSAFNFPVAVWAWNACLALVCGNPVIWKPSEKTPLSALAVNSLLTRALGCFGAAPNGLSQVLIGGAETAQALADHPGVALLSATGSTAMGKALAPRVAARLGRSLLELGGNNAAIICPSADLSLTIRAVLFAAVGTAGQRCTSLRRLLVHRSLHDVVVDRLKTAYADIHVGDPRQAQSQVGPLIDAHAFARMQAALELARQDGARIHGGQRLNIGGWSEAFYISPALVERKQQTQAVHAEVFAPILSIIPFDDIKEAICLNNAVPQGLASSIFTNDLREAEEFLASNGSDCGIANVNIGPSGAEIGGAFGGEKESGGGRESGSDCWKNYMRRATNTINYGQNLPLAQGIRFEVGTAHDPDESV
ncbi:Aldehyde dehydrogenase [Candidatus Terasakiella magnetica]|nr:Aldehyde dehydrogenase [Candidatus Terasakiella magnetica]